MGDDPFQNRRRRCVLAQALGGLHTNLLGPSAWTDFQALPATRIRRDEASVDLLGQPLPSSVIRLTDDHRRGPAEEVVDDDGVVPQMAGFGKPRATEARLKANELRSIG